MKTQIKQLSKNTVSLKYFHPIYDEVKEEELHSNSYWLCDDNYREVYVSGSAIRCDQENLIDAVRVYWKSLKKSFK